MDSSFFTFPPNQFIFACFRPIFFCFNGNYTLAEINENRAHTLNWITRMKIGKYFKCNCVQFTGQLFRSNRNIHSQIINSKNSCKLTLSIKHECSVWPISAIIMIWTSFADNHHSFTSPTRKYMRTICHEKKITNKFATNIVNSVDSMDVKSFGIFEYWSEFRWNLACKHSHI